ncbi:MAG TPA: hypothetical protein VJ622_03845 [Acidimicrobiia bacterium]|nr:hypothetical protein [Acidimicrobiia bacterium]
MAVVLGALAVGLVLLIAAVAILRESHRLASLPPRPTFDPDAALEWVVQHIADDAAATLTVDDVRVILDLQLQYFKAKGVSQNGSSSNPVGPVVVGGSETVSYILEHAAAQGAVFTPEQVHAVVETQLAYLRAIGAVGSKADDFDDE